MPKLFEFQISDWNTYHELDEDDEEKYAIQLFGRTDKDEDTVIKITGFTPFFYVEIPNSWNNIQVEKFVNTLQNKVSWRTKKDPKYDYDLGKSLIKYNVVQKYKFYGFTNKKLFKFVMLVFKSHTAMKEFSNVLARPLKAEGLTKEPVLYPRYESNIEPHIRFMHINNLSSCGWVRIEKCKLEKYSNYSYCEHSYQVDWHHVRPSDTTKGIAPFKIMGYDIECISCDENFPQAGRKTDKIIQIGITMYRYGSMECYEQHILVLGDCAKIKGANVECFKTERALIRGFAEKIREVRPDFMAGYNNFGFDDKYIFDRINRIDNEKAQKLGISIENMENKFLDDILRTMGKINNQFLMEEEGLRQSLTRFEIKNLSSSALGDNELKFFQIPGIISIDMMKVIQRDHRLDGYKLDNVSANFITEGVIKIVEHDDDDNGKIPMSIYTRSTQALEKNSYIQIMINDGYSSSPMSEGAKYRVLDIETKIESDVKDGKTIETKYQIIQTEIDPIDINELRDALANKSYKVFWTFAKDDMHHTFINQYFREQDAKKVRQIAVYCLKDCKLVNLLLEKLKIIVNSVGMAMVCHVPLSYLFLRGQGVKIFSLVSKKCRQRNFLIPVLQKKKRDIDGKEDEEESYEGAVVITPIPGVYFSPIGVLDFSSLYPNSMRERNLTHECYVNGSRLSYLEGYIYHDIYIPRKDKTGNVIKDSNGSPVTDHHRFAQEIVTDEQIDIEMKEIFDRIRENSDINEDEKKKQMQAEKAKIYNFAKGYTVRYGILPEILTELLNARKATNTKLAAEKDPFMCAILNSLQLAYKITANSLYGQTGAPTSSIYFLPIAASTTATGRERLYFAKDIVEKNFEGSEIVYGDSVTGDTPLILRDGNNDLFVTTIGELGKEWTQYEQFKSEDSNRKYKQQSRANYQVWTADGWANIRRVIRHKTNKKIYRILTHTGCVDVTEDHSLLGIDGQQIKPKTCTIGTELLHGFMEFKNNKCNINKKEAFVLGFFMRDGSCGACDTKYGTKYSWDLNNADLQILNKCKRYLEKVENIKFKILDTLQSSAVYKLVPVGKIKYMVEKYRPIFYNNQCLKVVPKEILNSTIPIKQSFLDGYFATDGCRADKHNIGCSICDIKGKIGAQSLFYLLKCLGYNVSINTRTDKNQIYRLTYSKKPQRKNPNAIKKKEFLGYTIIDEYNDFVYDLETESGTFHAGIGEMIVKNTDSIFINFHLHDKDGNERVDESALTETMDLARQAAKIINDIVPKPQSIVYEKTMHPLILVAKKKYVGLLFENDPKKFFLKSMGIVLKRRDNAPIVKIVVGGIIDNLLKKRDLKGAIKYSENVLNKLMSAGYPMDKFVISKTLKAKYKKPSTIAHKVLADRMAIRDPGNKPQVNDRIPFVYVVKNLGKKKKKDILQGDLIEHPEFVVKNKLKIDYLYYLEHQIINPATQILELLIPTKQVEKFFDKYIIDEQGKRMGRQSMEKWMENFEVASQEIISKKEEKVIDREHNPMLLGKGKKANKQSLDKWTKDAKKVSSDDWEPELN